MQVKNKSVKTWLPLFSGFYNTIWEYSERECIDYINEERLQGEIGFEHLEIDYNLYEKDIVLNFINILKEKLSNYVENIIFEEIISPKQYNYINDSVNVQIIPKNDNIAKFIYENKEKFCLYLKNTYTSCDGFISAYSNIFDVWEKETKNFLDFSINGHYLGSILHFICLMLEITEYDFYYDIDGEELNYITNLKECLNKPLCSNCNKFIENENIQKDIKKYIEYMNKYPSKVLCIECLENN